MCCEGELWMILGWGGYCSVAFIFILSFVKVILSLLQFSWRLIWKVCTDLLRQHNTPLFMPYRNQWLKRYIWKSQSIAYLKKYNIYIPYLWFVVKDLQIEVQFYLSSNGWCCFWRSEMFPWCLKLKLRQSKLTISTSAEKSVSLHCYILVYTGMKLW